MHGANPKALLYFGSLVPQFISFQQPIGTQLLYIAAIHLTTASLVLLIYSVLAARLGRMQIGEGARRAFSVAAGLVFVGSGVGLALARPSAE